MSNENLSHGEEPDYIKALKEGRDIVEIPPELMDEIKAAGPGSSLEELQARLDRYFNPDAL